MKIPATLRFQLRFLSQGALVVGLLLTGFSAQGRAETGRGSPDDLSVGFYLLHDVVHEETQVHLITLVKTTPPNLTDLVNRISKRATDTLTVIDRLEKDDSSLKLDQNPLPAFEQEVRQSIRGDKQHQLLWGTSGADFARALLVTQIEATNYICNIAKVLAQKDKDADRARTEQRISEHWTHLRDEAFRLLDAS